MLKRIAVLTSGGDSPGMNAAIREGKAIENREGAPALTIPSCLIPRTRRIASPPFPIPIPHFRSNPHGRKRHSFR